MGAAGLFQPWLSTVAALALLGAASCESGFRDETVPPFRIRAYGAGLDVATGGRRLDILDGDSLVARYRVGSVGMRVYGADASQLGRLRESPDGLVLERVDATEFCNFALDADGFSGACSETAISMAWSDGQLRFGGREVGALVAGEGEDWAFAYASDLVEPTIAFENGRASVRTHADARRWLSTSPTTWHPAALVMSQVELPGLHATDAALVQGAMAFMIAARFDARVVLTAALVE